DDYIQKTSAFFGIPRGTRIQVVESPPALLGLGAAYKPAPLFAQGPPTGLFYVDPSPGLGFHHEAARGFITAHEATPGHFNQLYLLHSLADQLHPVRFLDYTSDVSMGDYFSHENLEGWGLFAEKFAATTFHDFYSPQENAFLLQSIAWRAARAYIEPLIQSG